MKVYDLTGIVKKDEDGNFIATCPVLQGCYAGGETVEESLEMIESVIKMHIKDRLENGEAIREEIYSSQLNIVV